MSTKKDLILTALQSVGFDYIAPFIISLKRTGFQGQLVVFASDLKPETVRQIQDHGAAVVAFPYVSKRLREAFIWPVWPLWSRYFGQNGLTPMKEKLAHVALSLIYRRHLIALQYLRLRHGQFDRVFLTDARDVFFQADPFSWQPGSGMHFFLLSRANTIQTERLYLNWTENQFGRTDPQPYLDKAMACAGTTFGDTGSVINYLTQMVSVSLRARKPRKIIVGDQGVHNFLIYENQLPAMTLHSNEDGPVLTSTFMTMKDITLNSDGLVVNHQGKVIPILHQYDRIPDLKKHLLARLSPAV